MDCNVVYLMRHSERNKEYLFDSPLSKEGIENSKTVIVRKLEDYSFDRIYCSPYLRTIQTIAPYCRKYKVKIKLDWALVENLPEEEVSFSEFDDIIDSKYKPVISFGEKCNALCSGMVKSSNKHMEIQLLLEALRVRASKFLSSLKSGKVLVVTHLPVMNAFLRAKGHSTSLYEYHSPGSMLLLKEYEFSESSDITPSDSPAISQEISL